LFDARTTCELSGRLELPLSSFVSVSPDVLASASQGLTGIGSSITSANAAAAVSTTQVAVAAHDEVSAAIAAVFGSYARGYQTLAGQEPAFHDEFTRNLLSGAKSYAATEAASSNPLQSALDALAERRIQLLEQHRATLISQYREALAREDQQAADELMAQINNDTSKLNQAYLQKAPMTS
jgi:hypothetical protein